GAHVRAWQARAPMLPVEQRIAAAQTAASLGVFSNASLVELYSLMADSADPSEFNETVGGRLRTAFVARDRNARINALRDLWDDGGDDPVQRHARLILTATAAARILPSAELEEDAPELIASMLTGGLDARAAGWAAAADAMEGADGDVAWALVALASPRGGVDTGRLSSFASNDNSQGDIRTKLLVAGLAGLGKIAGSAQEVADDMAVNLNAQNRWTRLIDHAAVRGQQGTVVLLAAAGMQTGGWAGVPPHHLYRIVRALREVGLEYEARMIAAEAVARL
nr:hypothetical protein [Pseudomonadota bacterium]